MPARKENLKVDNLGTKPAKKQPAMPVPKASLKPYAAKTPKVNLTPLKKGKL